MKRWMLMSLMVAAAFPLHAADVRIVATPPPRDALTSQGSEFGQIGALRFPDGVEFRVEPFNPATNNQARAKIEIWYSCVPEGGGGRIVPCYISLEHTGRSGSGGHLDHSTDMPKGTVTPTAGWVSEVDGYLRTTYRADQAAGLIDFTVHCQTTFANCRDGTTVIGVGYDTFSELLPGEGYQLVGDKPRHPSNHWGSPNFVTALQGVARLFAVEYPGHPLLYNDLSLEYGGIFDVATRTQAGYDWTPPHRTHRLGTNLDMGIPASNARRNTANRLFQLQGVNVFQEDAFHWHLTY